MEKFKFSIVVPIYNVEKYLEETIESVINQTIGFEENIQIILVNDGSTDKSEEICLKYKEKHPKNIVYIKQENGGVSSARNKGIKYIEGKYVNFLDGDDKWSLDAFEIMFNFLEQNYETIDFAVARKKFFEAREEFHYLDYKFETTKIVDILEDYNYVQMDVTSVFFKSKIAKEQRFNENLQYAEDADFINRILFNRHKFGVVREAVHLYRKRADGTSALQKKSRSWYINTIENFHKKVFEISINTYGKILPYVQYMIMYDLQWRIKYNSYESLNEKEKNEYIDNIIGLLKNIDDHIIIEQKNIYSKFKLYALCLKYGRDITKELEFKDGYFYFNNLKVYTIKNKEQLFKMETIDLKRKVLKIKGRTKFAIPINTYNIFCNTNLENKTKINLQEDKSKEIITFKGYIFKNYTFNVEIPLKKNVTEIYFNFEYKNIGELQLMIGLGENIELDNSNRFELKNDKYKIKYNKKNLLIKKRSFKNRLKKRLKKVLKKIR